MFCLLNWGIAIVATSCLGISLELILIFKLAIMLFSNLLVKENNKVENRSDFVVLQQCDLWWPFKDIQYAKSYWFLACIYIFWRTTCSPTSFLMCSMLFFINLIYHNWCAKPLFLATILKKNSLWTYLKFVSATKG